MKRNNLWLISLTTAVVTVVSLNLVFGRSLYRNGLGYANWRHNHHHYCNDFDGDNTNRGRVPNRIGTDTTNY